MSKTGNIKWVDSAKGIAIILVVMMYAAYSVGEVAGNVSIFHYIIGFTTPFRMPEFFLISGLFLSIGIGRSWSNFLDKRFVHYLYFYVIWVAILIVVKIGIFSANPILALNYLGWAMVEPYSMLWFIYILAFFSLAAKIAYSLKIPHWVMLLGAAILQITPVQTISVAINNFSEYFIYFYVGYVFATQIFNIINYLQSRIILAIAVLIAFFTINLTLVFFPSYSINIASFELGLAGIPILHLIMALLGSLAVCLVAAMVSKYNFMNWLNWLGAHSIVVYLGFSLPMTISRELFLKMNIINDAGQLTFIIILIAVISPLFLYAIIQKTGIGKFLFERPQWAHIPLKTGRFEPKGKYYNIPAK